MILGVLVTYNPELQDLRNNLLAIKFQVDKLVIFDNDSINYQQIKNLCFELNLEFFSQNRNIGLGAAFNYILQKFKLDFDFFVTFDQDTYIEPIKTIPDLLKFFSKDNMVGIVGPSFTANTSISTFKYVNVLIQSCSIYKMEIFEKIGYFNEELFIDSVDFEICLRARLNKFLIIKCNDIFIQHNLGTRVTKLGIDFYQHNAIRNFYISRNHKYLTIKYFKFFPIFILKKNIFFVIHILKTIVVFRDKENFNSILKGLRIEF